MRVRKERRLARSIASGRKRARSQKSIRRTEGGSYSRYCFCCVSFKGLAFAASGRGAGVIAFDGCQALRAAL
jgi:hypothetical protein